MTLNLHNILSCVGIRRFEPDRHHFIDQVSGMIIHESVMHHTRGQRQPDCLIHGMRQEMRFTPVIGSIIGNYLLRAVFFFYSGKNILQNFTPLLAADSDNADAAFARRGRNRRNGIFHLSSVTFRYNHTARA